MLGFLIAIAAVITPATANTFKLSDHIVGGWVTTRSCATDTGMIFGRLNSNGIGEYGTLETNGSWTISGNRITVVEDEEMQGDRYIKKTAKPFTFTVVSIGPVSRFKTSDGKIVLMKRCPLPEGW